MAAVTRRLSKKEVPDGSLIAVFSDIHIPHHDERAVQLAVECCEDQGVTHVILNGDIADCGPASRHEKKKRRAVLDEGDLKASVAAGLWIFEWARTRPCWYILGNHEAWVEDYISDNPETRGSSVMSLMGLPEHGDGWEVLPNRSRISYGNRVWEHGNALFPSGAGGSNPQNRVKQLVPDRTTSIGHLHKKFASFWTTPDEEGNLRTRGIYGNGHMSNPESHEDYAAYASWQTSFELTRVYYVNGKPRFTTEQPEIHRDNNNKPVFEYGGKIYR
jgi:predicted phosphodiesterase